MKRLEKIIEVKKGEITYGTSLAETLMHYFFMYGQAKVELEHLEDKTLIHIFVEIETMEEESK
jgi:hypothetical protein